MEEIIQLLRHWEEYSNSRQSADLKRFGQWLDQKTSSGRAAVQEYGANADGLIGFLLGSLIGYSEVWTKLALKDLPLTGLTDFGILKYIEEHGDPSKKSIANHSVAENSTIFESIKRLQKQGLIEEKEDPTDRRVKRVTLTAEGKRTANTTTQSILNLSTLLVGDLNDEEKAQLTQLLRKLVSFHQDLYRQTDKAAIAKEYKL